MKSNLITVLLVILSGILLLSPYFNLQDILIQSDHGRDPNAFWATACPTAITGGPE